MKLATLCIFLAAFLAPSAWKAREAPSGTPANQEAAAPSSSQTGGSAIGAVNSTMSPAQTSKLLGLLQQVFLDAARAHDLLGLIQPVDWKVTDAERAAFEQQVTELRGQLRTLEKWRYAWFYDAGNSGFGQKTVGALGETIQQLRAVQDTVSRNQTAAAAVSLREPADHLEGLRGKLQAELVTLFPGRFAPPQPVAEASAPATPPAAQSAAKPAAVTQAKPTGKIASQPASMVSAAPPAPSGAPVAAPPQSQTARAATSAAAPAAAPLDPGQVKDLLSKVYLTTARVNDLVGLVQPDKWKMNDADRGLLQEKLSSLQSQMKALERARYQLFYHPVDLALARQAAAALGAVVPAIRVIATSVGQYGSVADASQLSQPAGQLEAAEGQLDSYSAYLQQKILQQLAARPAGLPGHVALETERITAPTRLPPPLSSVVIFEPPLTPAQVKAILNTMYTSEFRIRDLLSQERPDQWKASRAEQALVSQARETLLSQLGTLETWRARLYQDPENMYDAFQVFRSVDEVFLPLRVFSREIIRYRGAGMGEPYRRRADDLEANLNALMPYIGAILQHASDNASMIQTDLDTCQNQLTYAMHGMLHAPASLKNVVPVFEGRRARARRQAAKDKAAHP